jgi:antitoxin YefM
MRSITYSEARANLAKTMDAVSDDQEPVVITRGRRQAFVLMTLEQYEAMDDTAYLLRSPANAARLKRAIEEVESGGGMERQPDLDA